MIRILFSRFWPVVATVAFALVSSLVLAGEEKFDATITYCGGQTTSVKDIRMVYSWREMPASGEGLVPYKEKNRVEQGVLIIGGSPDQPRFQVVSFRDLDSIEFDCDIQQLGETPEHQLRVRRIWLKRLDGERAGYSAELLGGGRPVFWPQNATLKFPDNADAHRIDRRMVRLRGLTKIEGQDSEFVFVFPPPSAIGIQSVVKKQRDAFPRTIRFAHPETAGLDRAQQ